jgi:hypothetical protein
MFGRRGDPAAAVLSAAFEPPVAALTNAMRRRARKRKGVIERRMDDRRVTP